MLPVDCDNNTPSSGSALSDCKISSDGFARIPNFPQKILKSLKNLSESFHMLAQDQLYIVSMSPRSSEFRKCSGLMKKLEFCYIADAGSFGSRQPVFILAYLAKYEMNFKVVKKARVSSTPLSNICVNMSKTHYVCCDHQSIADDVMLPLSLHNFSYGIFPLIPNILYFSEPRAYYDTYVVHVIPNATKAEQYRVRQEDVWSSSSIPLLAFIIGKDTV